MTEMTSIRIGARFHPRKISAEAAAADADMATTHFSNLRMIKPQLTNYKNDDGIPVTIHAPYTVNIGHFDGFVREAGFEMLKLNAQLVAERGALGVTFHGGTRKGTAAKHWKDAWQRIADYEWPCRIMVENGAQVKGSISCDIHDISDLFDILLPNPQIGFTLDTAHVYSHVSDEKGRADYVKGIRLFCGDRIWLIHANGSAVEAGGGVDVHAPFSESLMSPQEVVELARLSGCNDLVCETRDAKGDIAKIREVVRIGHNESITRAI